MIAYLAAKDWGLFVLRGALALLLGLLAFVAPGPTLAALILVFAFYAIFDGVLAVAAGLGAPAGPRWLIVVGGIIAIAIGIYTGFNPSVTATALVVLIGAFILVRGVVDVAAGFAMRSLIPDAWVIVLSGIVSIAFGGYLLVSPPSDGALAVIYLVGFYALFAGVMYVVLGFRLRTVNEQIEHTTQSTGTTPA